MADAVSQIALDGRRVAYREAGRGRPGTPLLLVHGWTGAGDDFGPVLEALAERRRVVAVDLPGHGASQGPADPAAYTLEALATWVLRTADVLQLGPELHLLGHSMGGLVVQRVAAAASQRLRSLILMATGLGALRDELADDAARFAELARAHGLEAAYAAAQQERPPVPDLDEHGLARQEQVRRRFLRMDVAAVVAGAGSLITAMPLGAFLRGIDVPVLVVTGADDDRWTPAEQALLARTVAGAEHVVIAGAQHSPQLEQPAAWLAAVTDFLGRAEHGSTALLP